MLSEAGLHRSTCFVTNVSRQRPPNNKIEVWMARKPVEGFVPMRDRYVHPAIAEGFQHLLKEVAAVKPNLIVALGNVSMWALTGKWGITDQRGSELMVDWMGEPTKVIPTYHPAAILQQWSWRSAAVADLKRAARNAGSREYERPQWVREVQPTYEHVMQRLEWLLMLADGGPLRLVFDLETFITSPHITCAGIGWSKTEALCIPLTCSHSSDGYWPLEQEVEIVWTLRRLLTHENALVEGQNLLFDVQHTYRSWGFVPRVCVDTMITFHSVFCEAARDDTNEKTGKKGKGQSGVKKSLDYLASLFCESYVQWKGVRHASDVEGWLYNGEDCVRTWEVADGVRELSERLGRQEVCDRQHEMFWPVLRAMQRGVRIDTEMRDRLSKELKEGMKEREKWVTEVLGHKLNPRSPKQMQALFYGDFAQKPILKRRGDGKWTPTLDDDALMRLAHREPGLRPLVTTMLDTRTLGTLRSTFIQAPLDADGRMRCSYNICGTLTYRLSSSENAFGSGANLQNLPSEKSKVNVKVANRGTGLTIPNVRAMFIPDPGYTFFDMDLERADLQVVAWEADDPTLKQMLREGVDIHSENAKLLGINRETSKVWVHGTDYGGSPRTMAQQCGVTVHAATQLQRKWFGAHPGIEKWHRRVEHDVTHRKWVENAWGYRWYIFGRPEGMLPEALAWIPQSTVAILINRIWKRIYDEMSEVEITLQVHDSLAGQFPSNLPDSPERLRNLARIPIPYSDPLIIPANPKTSTVSWGDCG
jgi:uracil-DNA glycosylase family 4